jgi:pimeloyl-ACP methyl ester carboxylesterase
MGETPSGTDLPYLHRTGTGPPLLFLHAFPQDASMWDQQVAALSGSYDCLRPDAFGCGSSPPPPAGLTLEGWAAAVLNVLDEVDVDRVPVVGASMGGYLAFALLREAPERVAGLCLLGSRARADSEPTRADRAALVTRLRDDGPSAIEQLVENQPSQLLSKRGTGEFHISDPVRGRIRRCTPAGLATISEILAARPDSTPLLATIDVPTLVVAGGEDALVPVEEARAMASGIPGARFEVMEGSGHLVSLERAQAVNSLMAAWLGGVRRDA